MQRSGLCCSILVVVAFVVEDEATAALEVESGLLVQDPLAAALEELEEKDKEHPPTSLRSGQGAEEWFQRTGTALVFLNVHV